MRREPEKQQVSASASGKLQEEDLLDLPLPAVPWVSNKLFMVQNVRLKMWVAPSDSDYDLRRLC